MSISKHIHNVSYDYIIIEVEFREGDKAQELKLHHGSNIKLENFHSINVTKKIGQMPKEVYY